MSDTCPLCNGTGQVDLTRHPFVTEHDKHRIKTMLEGGMTYRAIGEAIGFSAAVVYKHAKLMGVNSRFRKNIITSMEARDAVAQKDLPQS